MDEAVDPVDPLVDVDALLALVVADAPLDDLLDGIVRLVEGQHDDVRCVVHVPGLPATVPPAGGESHAALVDAAVDRAAATGETFTLNLPAGPWTSVLVCPTAVIGSTEVVAVVVVWAQGTSVSDLTGDAALLRCLHLASIALTGQADADAVRRSTRVDPLTGLANRRRLDEALGDLESDADRPPCAVLSLDVDEFRALNDRLGPDACDHVLVIVAERLRGSVRSRDLIARVEGDTFAVLCHEVVDEAEAEYVAARLTRVVAEPMVVDHEELRVHLTSGVAFAARGESVRLLADEADQARLDRASTGVEHGD